MEKTMTNYVLAPERASLDTEGIDVYPLIGMFGKNLDRQNACRSQGDLDKFRMELCDTSSYIITDA
jgi:hypothetical protein